MEDILKKVSRIKDKKGFKIQELNNVIYLYKKTKNLNIIVSVQQAKEQVILISYKKIKRGFEDFVSMEEENEIITQFEDLSLSDKSFKLCTKENYITELKRIMDKLSYSRTRKDLLESFEYQTLNYNEKIKIGNTVKFEEAIKSKFLEVEIKRNKESYGTISLNIPIWNQPTYTTLQINVNRHNEVSIREYSYKGNWPKDLIEKINERVLQTLSKIDDEIKWYKETENIKLEIETEKKNVRRRELSSKYIIQGASVKKLAWKIQFHLNDKKRKRKPIKSGVVYINKNIKITKARRLKFACFRKKNLIKVVLYRNGMCLDDFPTFSRPGYVFLGWFTERKKGVEVTKENLKIRRDINLYAHWRKGIEVTINHYQLPLEEGEDAYLIKAEKRIITKLPKEVAGISKYKREINGYNYDYEKESLDAIDYDQNIINLYYEREKFEIKILTDKGIRSVTGEGKHFAGTTVELKAEMNEGFVFSRWKQGFKLVNKNPYTLIMPKEDVTISVHSSKGIK